MAEDSVVLTDYVAHQAAGTNRTDTLSCRSLNITVALYEQGALLLADTISDNNSRVVLVGRDLTMPPVGIGTGSGPGLREYVTVIERPIAGNRQ